MKAWYNNSPKNLSLFAFRPQYAQKHWKILQFQTIFRLGMDSKEMLYLSGGAHGMAPSCKSGSKSEISSLTMSEPLWNLDFIQDRDTFTEIVKVR